MKMRSLIIMAVAFITVLASSCTTQKCECDNLETGTLRKATEFVDPINNSTVQVKAIFTRANDGMELPIVNNVSSKYLKDETQIYDMCLEYSPNFQTCDHVPTMKITCIQPSSN